MAYHQSQSTMTDAWLKPLLDSRDSVGLLMILSYMIVMLLNMLIMLEPSSKDVWINRFHSTWTSAIFFQTEVTFAGFQLSSNGYQVDRSITDAISNFPAPTSRTELRSFFGLVNQLSASTSTISSLLAPLRPLLSTKNDFLWSPTHSQAFQAAKEYLTVAPVLSFFDIDKPTRLCTDASRHGLGFVLQQQNPDGKWCLTQAGSRFLSDAEGRYAIIELELLAVCWAIVKCHTFLAGLQHFQVITDHNPLIPILNNHRLDEIENPRLQRLRTRIMGYNFTAEWLKGTNNSAPDALSRSPVSDPAPHDILAELDILNQPDISISEIRAISATVLTWIHYVKLLKMTSNTNNYDNSSLMAFLTTAHSSLTPVNDTGLLVIISPLTMTS